jgi:hypothetical protein
VVGVRREAVQKQDVLSVPAPTLSGCEPTVFVFHVVQQLANRCKVTIPDKSGIRTLHNGEAVRTISHPEDGVGHRHYCG